MSALLPDEKSQFLAIQSPEDEDGFMNILVDMKDDANNITPTSEQSYYHEEWKKLFEVPDYVAKLRSLGQRGKLKNSSFRSICWKLFLECLPEDQSEWIKITWASRQKYRDLQENLSTNPRMDGDSMDLSFNNPLSQETQSPWNRFFQDGELKLTIRQDVIRTFPEINFFHTPQIQSMMVNILFSYAREFPEISYRQGMHEILAPIIFVLHSDQQAFQQASDENLISLEIREILDPEFTEHDAYFLFCKVMDLVQSWYIMGENKHHKMEHLKLAPFSQPPEFGPNSYIEVKLTKIHNLSLRQQDSELYNHLKNLEIAPQIYGIRWLRLLFGREFIFPDLLMLWDAIFGNGISFDLVDYIFCAMLMSIRDLLLRGDYTTCLKYLMRYPPTTDAKYVLDLSLHLKDPLTYSKPSGTSHHIQPNSIPVPRPGQCIQSSVQNGNQIDRGRTRNGNVLRPKSLALSMSNVPLNNVPNKPTMDLDSKSPSPEQENVLRRIIRRPSFNGQSCAKPSYDFKQHQRHQSDDLEKIVHRDVAQLINGDIVGTVQPSRKSKSNGTDIKLHRSGLSQSMNHLDGKKSLPVCKEMVPIHSGDSSTIALSERNSLFRSSRSRSHDKDEELRILRTDVSQLCAMKNYCWSRMTRHLDRLQDALVKQELQHEDELFLALAGLKRVRDILKGTLTFSEDVISDEESKDVNDWLIVDGSRDRESPTSTVPDDGRRTSGLDSVRRVQKLLFGFAGSDPKETK